MTILELYQWNRDRLESQLEAMNDRFGKLLITIGVTARGENLGKPFCLIPEDMTQQEAATMLRFLAHLMDPKEGEGK